MPFSVKAEAKGQYPKMPCQNIRYVVFFSSLPLFIFPCELIFVNCDVRSAEKQTWWIAKHLHLRDASQQHLIMSEQCNPLMRSLDQVRASYSILAFKGEMSHFLAQASAKLIAYSDCFHTGFLDKVYFNIQKHTSPLNWSDSNDIRDSV